jgi:catechol 1,2-dioxygenase
MKKLPASYKLGVFGACVLLSVAAVACAEGRKVCAPTPENVEGPYYLPDAPFRERIATPETGGSKLTLAGTVFAQDCFTPLTGAVIDVWQTDASGEYDFSNKFRLRGRARADSKGIYRVETIVPGRYRAGRTYRPAHIHLRVSHPEGRTLVTQVYFRGDPELGRDPFVLPALIIPLERDKDEEGEAYLGVFDIVLRQPEGR